MSEGMSIDINQMISLSSSVRVSANSSFNAQDAYDNTFEDLIQDEATKIEEKQNKNNINFLSLGMPAGFELDTSLLEAMENGELNQQNSNQSQYLLNEFAN